jgi:hypothetical protein
MGSPAAHENSLEPSGTRLPVYGSQSSVIGKLFCADSDVDGEECHQCTDGEDDRADQQASGVPIGQRPRGGVPRKVFLGDDRGDGGQRAEADGGSYLDSGVLQARGRAAFFRCDPS